MCPAGPERPRAVSGVEDDFYVFDAARSQLVGRRSRRVIRWVTA